MGVKNNPQIGTITCPCCQGAATVHSCLIGRGAKKEALYIRCGTVSNGCGCIQPYGPTGQAFIRENMNEINQEKPELEPAPKPEPVADAGAASANDEWKPEEETGNDAVKPRKRGFFASLLEE